MILDRDRQPIRPVTAHIERTYERPKGEKILSRVPVEAAAMTQLDPNWALLQFDTIFALDSNTRTIRGHCVSVAANILAKWVIRHPEPKLGFARSQAIEFRDIDCHPDLLALKCHIQSLSVDPRLSEAGRVAFIIDSHLGNIEAIQARACPILDDVFLPSWASLIYASDAAADSISNKLLQEADVASRVLLDEIEHKDWRENSQKPFTDHGTYFRVWELADPVAGFIRDRR